MYRREQQKHMYTNRGQIRSNTCFQQGNFVSAMNRLTRALYHSGEDDRGASKICETKMSPILIYSLKKRAF